MSELKICRVCLNTNVQGYSFNTNNLREEYENVTASELSAVDELPQWACYECASLLHKFHKFKEKCNRGQKVLERIKTTMPISYKSIALINRTTENLISRISLIETHLHTKTFTFKHQSKKEKEKITVEVYYDSEDAMKEEIEIPRKQETIEIEVKNEPIPETEDILDADNSQDASSDDENIFLDIIKKAVNGENQFVFLDGVKEEIDKTKPRKFMKRKKEYLSMEYWKKYRLTEEEANVEFRRKEKSDKYLKANYQCHNCLKGFSKLEMLMRHVKMKHDESLGPLECRFCHMRFKRKCMLTKHMVQHYAVYHCLRCDMRFYLETSAIFHEDYHNGVIRKCKHCGEEFKHSSTFYTHMRMAHRSSHVCGRCGVSFVSAAGLAQHHRIKHFEQQPTEPSSDSPEKNIYCEKCELKFTSQTAYDLHLSHSEMHTDGIVDGDMKRRNYKGKASGDGSRKATKKAKKPTTCIHCGKHFVTQTACMKHHLTEHPRQTFYSADQRHICEVCGASLAAVSIASHMNRHTRENVYPCDICGMQFISKSSHHRHQVYWADKKCTLKKTCAQHAQSLNRTGGGVADEIPSLTPIDQRLVAVMGGPQFAAGDTHVAVNPFPSTTHTGERPYPCPLCEKRFTQKNSMQLHYRTFHLKQPYPKRNRKRKTDEMPIVESCRERDESDTVLNRWRIT